MAFFRLFNTLGVAEYYAYSHTEVDMIKIDSFWVKDTFFAARNSHGGFQSLFDEVFNPREYAKLFILKGGPGTGKSTFKRVAVIDGTAPHCKDPIFPGAVDEIINLGESFKTDVLEEKKDEILELSEAKGRGYKSAYLALKNAKGVFDYIWHSLCSSAFYNEAELLSKTINIDYKNGIFPARSTAKLYSAFGKDGYKILPPAASKTVVKIGGTPLLISLFLDAIYRGLKDKNPTVIRVPSALDERVCERIIIGDTTLIYDAGGECDIDLHEYKARDFCECFESVNSAYTSLLDLAILHFKEASDAHFGLEKIYSSAVDFENNERLFGNLCDRLGDIFA